MIEYLLIILILSGCQKEENKPFHITDIKKEEIIIPEMDDQLRAVYCPACNTEAVFYYAEKGTYWYYCPKCVNGVFNYKGEFKR